FADSAAKVNHALVLDSAAKAGTAASVTGTVAIANGGTGQTTANAALNALLPSQTSKNHQFIQTDGTNASWAAVNFDRVPTSAAIFSAVTANNLVACDPTTNAIEVDLPATGLTAGYFVVIKDETREAATHNITIKTTDGSTIDGTAGSSGVVLSTNGAVERLYYTGSNWVSW
ncbi:hypothetical protein KGP36_01975, partial [Patescibacteria group bacterium]|nr:hypothetical protein [Patescibacteria group bacterium]